MGDLILLEQPSVIKDVSASTLLQLGVDSKCAVCVCAKDFTALEPTWARELKLQCVQVPVVACSADDVLPAIAKAVISEVKSHRRSAQGSSSSSSRQLHVELDCGGTHEVSVSEDASMWDLAEKVAAASSLNARNMSFSLDGR